MAYPTLDMVLDLSYKAHTAIERKAQMNVQSMRVAENNYAFDEITRKTKGKRIWFIVQQ